MTAGDAFFRRDGDRFLPSDQARGPWNRETLHGRVVAGLLARTIEQNHHEQAFQFARLTVDLFRAPPFEPVEVATSIAREGNRIRVADGVMTSGGVEIARASAVMLRRAPQPSGEVWGPPPWDVPAPDEIASPATEAPPGGTPMWETRPIDGDFGSTEQKRAWLRETRSLVDGEAPSPFVRVALAADFTNPFANSGSGGLNFVNADVTLYLHRLPVGEWLGFEVAGHHSADGIAVAECALYDTAGAIGRSTVCALANEHRR
jgi:hypothetical protein